jgi:hypothetical protein
MLNGYLLVHLMGILETSRFSSLQMAAVTAKTLKEEGSGRPGRRFAWPYLWHVQKDLVPSEEVVDFCQKRALSEGIRGEEGFESRTNLPNSNSQIQDRKSRSTG